MCFINKQLEGGYFRLTVYQGEQAHTVRNLHKHSVSTELYRRNTYLQKRFGSVFSSSCL